MLPAGCSRRLVVELQGALDSCAERQRELEQRLRVSRRLLRAWGPADNPAPEPTPGPETEEEDPSPECTPSPQDLKELELLTQVLEKAARVRKGIAKPGERGKAPSHKSGSISATPALTSSAPPRASGTKPPRGICQTIMPAKALELRLLASGDQTCSQRRAGAARPPPNLKDQQVTPSTAPAGPAAFTLKEKGTLLQLPMAFRKAASRNARLWAQLSSTQTGDSMDAAAKTQFLQNMQTTSGCHASGLRATEVEVGHLRRACLLLRRHMEGELVAAPEDWMQEYRCLLTLDGLQALVGQCLHRLQGLRTVVVEQPLELWPEGRLPGPAPPCEAGADAAQSPQRLLYSSTQELQALVALRLRVAMLEQQIHLQKVLMAELLPLVGTQEPQGPHWLALCRAVHSLLCEGGESFLTILRDDPAD